MRISGLGSLGSLWPSGTPEVPECGPSPCTWYDNIWARDACVNYMVCAAPNDPSTIALTEGMFAGAGAEAGEAVGDIAGGIFGGLTSAGVPGWVIFAGIAVGGLVLINSLKR
jgi:hypothetical protein